MLADVTRSSDGVSYNYIDDVCFVGDYLRSLDYRRTELTTYNDQALLTLVRPAGLPVPDIEILKLDEVKEHTRLPTFSTEARLGRRLRDDDPMLTWLPKRAAELLKKYPACLLGTRTCIGRKTRCEAGMRKETKKRHRTTLVEGRFAGHHGRTGGVVSLF